MNYATMTGSRLRTTGAIAFAVAAMIGSSQTLHASTLVVDRGLPNMNLNSAAGVDRSNYALGLNSQEYDDGEGSTGLFKIFPADDFTLASTGDPAQSFWQIDKLTVWVVGSSATSPPGTTLGANLNSISLYLGESPGGIFTGGETNVLPLVVNAAITGNDTNNSNVVVTEVTYAGGENFEGGQGMASMYQVDFLNVGAFAPGDFVFAIGGDPVDTAQPFVHGSNADLSSTTQEGSDGYFSRVFSSPFTGDIPGEIYINGSTIYGYSLIDPVVTWNSGVGKPVDLNVQVTASSSVIPEPTSLALLGLGGLLAVRRRRR